MAKEVLSLIKSLKKCDGEKAVACVKKFVDEGGDINAPTKDGECVLHEIVRQGYDETLMKFVLALEAVDVDLIEPDTSETPLMQAISSGHTQHETIALCRALIEKGCDLNKTDDTDLNESALHIAAALDCTYIISLLLQHGSNINMKNKNNETPLHTALESNSEAAAVILIASGADLKSPNRFGKPPIHMSISAQLDNITEAALEALTHTGADLRAYVDADLNTPLHLACDAGLTRLIHKLQDMGFDEKQKNREGKTAVDRHIEREERLENLQDLRRRKTEEREEKKKFNTETDMQSKPVTQFCHKYNLPTQIVRIFYSKKIHVVDDTFLQLDDAQLKKLGLKEDERDLFIDTIAKHVQEEENKVITENQKMYLEDRRRRRVWNAMAIVILLVIFVLLYIYLKFLETQRP